MENHSDNPMHELEGLKQQFKDFNQHLEDQQIVDADKVQYVVNNCRSHFQRHRRNVLICYPLAMILFAGTVLLVGGYASFALLSVLFLLLGMVAELWITKDLVLDTNTMGLVKWAQQHYTAKRLFLLYYLVLICSLFYIIFIVGVTLDVPNEIVDKVKIVIISLFGLSLVGFLMLYLPIYRQCNEVLSSVKNDIDKSGSTNKGFRFYGLVILIFAAATALHKLLLMPGGSLLMIFTGVLIVVYAVVGAIRLRRLRHCPVILSILIVLTVPLMTYLLMARINCWPLGGPDRYNTTTLYPQAGVESHGDLSVVEICSDYRHETSAEMCAVLKQAGIESSLIPDSPALISVRSVDTAEVNVILAESGFPVDEGLATRWSLPDTDGKCMLFLVHSTPIVESHPGEAPVLTEAFLQCKSQNPHWLEINLSPEATTLWQSAVFQFVQRQSQTTVAIVFQGVVICQGAIDRDNIGYQRLRFHMPQRSSFSESMLEEMVQN